MRGWVSMPGTPTYPQLYKRSKRELNSREGQNAARSSVKSPARGPQCKVHFGWRRRCTWRQCAGRAARRAGCRVLAHCIVGHHAGLADWKSTEADAGSLRDRLKVARKRDLLRLAKDGGVPTTLLSALPSATDRAGWMQSAVPSSSACCSRRRSMPISWTPLLRQSLFSGSIITRPLTPLWQIASVTVPVGDWRIVTEGLAVSGRAWRCPSTSR